MFFGYRFFFGDGDYGLREVLVFVGGCGVTWSRFVELSAVFEGELVVEAEKVWSAYGVEGACDIL